MFRSISRARPSLALALLVGCLGAVTASGQSSAGSSTTGAAAGATGSSGSSTTGSTGSTSGSYQNSNTSAADPTRTTDNQASLKRTDRRFLMKAVEGSQKEVAISQLAAQRATSGEVKNFAQQLVSEHQKMNAELMQLAQRKGVTMESLGLGSRSMSMSGGSGAAGSSSTESSTNAGIASDNGAPRATGAAGTAGTPASTGIPTSAATATSGSGAAGSMSATADISADLTADRHYRNLARRTGADFDREYVDLMVDHHETDVQLFQKASKNAQDSDIRSFASSHLPKLQSHLDHANSLMKSAAE